MKKVSLFAILLIAVAQFSFTNFQVSTNQASKKVITAATPIVFTTNDYFDVSLLIDIPCAGETVLVEGQIHAFNHFTINGNTVVTKGMFQYSGITGVGSVSGNKYQATGVLQDTFKGSLVNGQVSYTFKNTFSLIGPGSGNNLLVHVAVHTTVNADGTASSQVENINEECR